VKRLLLIITALMLVTGLAYQVGADGMLTRVRRPPAVPVAPSPDVPQLLGAPAPAALPPPIPIGPASAPLAIAPTGGLAELNAAPTDVAVDEIPNPDIITRVIELGGYGPEWGSGGSGYSY